MTISYNDNTNVGTCVRSSIEVSSYQIQKYGAEYVEEEVQFSVVCGTELVTAYYSTVLVGRVEEYHLDAYLATCKIIV